MAKVMDKQAQSEDRSYEHEIASLAVAIAPAQRYLLLEMARELGECFPVEPLAAVPVVPHLRLVTQAR